MNGRIYNLAISITLLAGVALATWGLLDLTWPQAVPWDQGGFRNLSVFIVACVGLVITFSFFSKLNPLVVAAAIMIFLALLAGALWPLLVALWFIASSTLLGRASLSALKINADDGWPIHFLIGAGLYGTFVGLLAHFPFNFPGVYGVALAVPLVLGGRSALGCLHSFKDLYAKKGETSLAIKWLDGAIVVIALIYFVVALMPELGHDALAVHLFIPAHMASRHQWGFDAGMYVGAVMPALGDWIFTIGYMMGGETAARLINISFIYVLGWLVRDLVLWAGGSVFGARWAVLIFLSTPLTFTEGSKLFIESVWAGFVVGAALTLLRLYDSPNKSKLWIALAALLLGFSVETKAVTLTIMPVFIILVILHYKYVFKETSFISWLIAACLFLLVGLIPYITALLLTGNPVFPFFNGIFKSPYYPPVNFEVPSVFGKGLTFDALYQVTFNSHKFLEAGPGAFGFQSLIFFVPVTILAILNKRIKVLILMLTASLIVLLVFQSMAYLRYVFPALALFAAFIGSGIGLLEPIKTNKLLKIFVYSIAVGSVALNILFLSAGAMHRDFPVQSIWSNSNRDSYLQKRLPIRNAVDLVNKLNHDRTPVAIFAHPMTAGIESDVLYPSWYNFKFQRQIEEASNEQDFASVLLSRGVDWIILDLNWTGSSEKKRLINNVSDLISEIGTINVRKIKDEYRFKKELLKNPDFSLIEGWTLEPGAQYDASSRIVTANVETPGTQVFSASPGQTYLNSVVARCSKLPTMGRIQINWLDAKGQFIKADIKTFDCTLDWAEREMEVISPPSAALGVVYVSGHTSIPLQFKSNSLKQ